MIDNRIQNNVLRDGQTFLSTVMLWVDPVVENNILDNVPNQRSDWANDYSSGGVSGAHLANNHYVNGYNDYYAWSAFTPIGNPSWSDPDTSPDGFRVLAGSPLIDPPVHGGSGVDFDGLAPRATRDIGVYEYRGVSTPHGSAARSR